MYIAWFLVCLFVFFGAPVLSVHSSVTINEVAWMGTDVSTADEWIEFYSADGSDLTDWHLIAEDGAMDITLSGSIAAGGYFLIERTDDTSVPGVTADVVTPFGSGLSNGGEILALRSAGGVLIDRIDASSGWPAGDNTTKATMQRVSSGWISASSTPRAANAINSDSGSTGQNNNPPGSTATSSDSGSATNPANNSALVGTMSSGVRVPPSLAVYAGQDRTVFQGASLEFRGRADGINGEPLVNARFSWNLGDGTTKEGKIVTHTYYFPGQYQVGLSVSSGEYSGADYLKIAVVSPGVVISEVKTGLAGFIEFYNNTDLNLDLGGFTVSDGSKNFVIERGTFIGGKSVLVLANAVTGVFYEGGGLKLKDALGQMVDSFSAPVPLNTIGSYARAYFDENYFVRVDLPTPGVYEPLYSKFEVVVKTNQVISVDVLNEKVTAPQAGKLADESKPNSEEEPSVAKGAEQNEPVEGAASILGLNPSAFFFSASIIIGLIAAGGFILFRL